MPRSRPARSSSLANLPARLPAALLAVAVVVAGLAGCAGPDEPTTPAGPVTYDVPEIPVRVTAPAGWERRTRDGAFVLRSPDGSPDGSSDGAGDFRANVVVTGEPATGGLDDAAVGTSTAVAAIPGWTVDIDGQGATTLGGLPAYRVSGTYETQDARVAQETLAVEAGTQPDRWIVHLTASYAADDADGAAQARGILESLEVAPTG